MTHTVVLGADVYGNVTRMDNVIDGIAGKLKTASAELTETQVQMENAREEMKAPFAKEDGGQWTGTWAAAAEFTGPSDMPKESLSERSLREIVKVSIGGSTLRLQLSNEMRP